MKYKQKCIQCKKNYVPVRKRKKYVVCYECQKEKLHQEVKDPEMKKMFDIPEEFYKKNAFLRDIKVKYHRYGELTERQIEVFKDVVKKMKKKRKKKD